MEIIDKDFKLILDTIISIEKQREYYHSKLLFVISISESNSIDISTINDPPDDVQSIFGLFFYNNEKFIVKNYNLIGNLFNKTEKTIEQTFIIDGLWIDKKTGKKKMVYKILDSSRSIWKYKYNNEGKLELVDFYNTDR
ncbi:MAG: hypothetical protein LBE13_16740 [Bacteroidales bacterium]|nr:hypothetical protein [Bacteroidales bacterium]